MKSNQKKALAYYRSVGHQVFNTRPADANQRELVTKYAEENEIEIVTEFASCSTRYAKNELQNALRHCTNNKEVKYLLIKSFDRISRNPLEYFVWKKAFADCGVEIISVTQPRTDTPTGALMEAITIVFADYESERIKENARRKKAAQA